ncbi:hypothetical protein Patl1_34645 [Pistacia atlantica]|uniref:Uncharacterized protein n=1 Tax=Pistacia atlantica TaxID=434234 RepID=A0ACC0ZTM4_9ROSI|nr:hypothetical protein Patl1_34645 [Pistacia atlantica]
MSSKPNQHIDERQWIINIRRTLEEELELSDIEIPVCIFSVPKPLRSGDPDSYTPQEVAIGPYHYWRPELYEMERNLHGDFKFQYVVEQLSELEPTIRACYHKFLDVSSETLTWMMAIDASFLLEFLQIYAIKEGKASRRVSSRSTLHILDYAGSKADHNAILRDMVMLENQIPLFALRKMLEVQYSSSESADEMLEAMLIGFYEELSPFKMMQDTPKIRVSESAHLLDYLYDTIVPKDNGGAAQKDGFSGDSTFLKKLMNEIWKLLSKLNKRPIRLIQKILLSKLPGLSILAQPLQVLMSGGGEEKDPDGESDSNKPPLVEEITIPSVTELLKSQVRFVAAKGNISTISFDSKKAIFRLPIISLDVNTEVILRNLVAYEASNASGPLAFTRYTELMNGIIDSEEDVKILRERGIIFNRLKSDAEVANMWNGMNKSIRLTKVPQIDKVIEDVNKYYNSRWKVKLGKYMRLYVFGSWQFLTLLATILLLLLVMLQAFCSVYNCRKFNLASTFE